jgi:hypothetical protein
MDVVYPYKKAHDDFELRYSLRSLVNMEHGRVFVAGDKPVVTGKAVTHIPVGSFETPYQSSTANIRAAIVEGGITGEFVVMHDDIFLLKPWQFRHEHRGTIAEYLATGRASGLYRAHIEATRDILEGESIKDPLWFGLHTPTVYDVGKLLDLIDRFEGQRFLLRTLYHNLYPQPATRRDDVKAHQWTGDPDATDLLSISDSVARSEAFRVWVAERFPDRCRYEIAADGRCLILGYGPTLWQDVDRALDEGGFAAVIASPEAAAHWPGEVLAIAHNDDHADQIAALCGFEDVTWCGRTKEAA